MKFLTIAIVTLSVPLAVLRADDLLLVEDGRPRAEIVVAEQPARMARMAAHEFRETIEKISGARLPIVTMPTGKAVKVFIGASPHNPVTADGLATRRVPHRHGAGLAGTDRRRYRF
jgi:hypothetical protein